MSNEPYNDDKVSRAYRSLAGEKTPAHLDRKILKMAAAEAQQPRYSRWMAWSRPLAWAATITLCLAITLELARQPEFDSAPEMPAETAARVTAPEEPGAGLAEVREQDAASLTEEAEIRELDDSFYDAEDSFYASEDSMRKVERKDSPEALAEAIIAEKTALGRSSARQPVAEPMLAARVRQSTEEYVATPETAAVEDVLVAAQVDEQTANQTDTGLRAEAPRASTSNMAYSMQAAVASDADAQLEECTAEIRSEPETWLDCILELEDAGNIEAGDRHRDALIDTFPDFKLP